MLGWLFGQYWEIGRRIQEAVGDRAAYGKQLLAYLSERLTVDFGPGFTQRELRRMRQFYQVFSIRCALRPELSWTHYRLLMRVENEERRTWYMNEAADAGWSSRQLDRQIQTFYYDRLLATQGDDAKREVAQEIETTQPVTSAHRRGAGRGPASRARRGRGRVAVACARRRWLRGGCGEQPQSVRGLERQKRPPGRGMAGGGEALGFRGLLRCGIRGLGRLLLGLGSQELLAGKAAGALDGARLKGDAQVGVGERLEIGLAAAHLA